MTDEKKSAPNASLDLIAQLKGALEEIRATAAKGDGISHWEDCDAYGCPEECQHEEDEDHGACDCTIGMLDHVHETAGDALDEIADAQPIRSTHDRLHARRRRGAERDCPSTFTDRGDEHRTTRCDMIEGHKGAHYDQRSGAEWTDEHHYDGSPGRTGPSSPMTDLFQDLMAKLIGEEGEDACLVCGSHHDVSHVEYDDDTSCVVSKILQVDRGCEHPVFFTDTPSGSAAR